MGHCNLKPSDDCYGCPYWGLGDTDGCELTIKFCKTHPEHTDEEYAEYMTKHERRKL